MKVFVWPEAFIVISSFLFASTDGDFLTGANQAVRCMLSHSSPRDCASLPKVIVPSYLLQVYNDSPTSLHEALRNQNITELSEEQVSDIPISLLYLIPRARLVDLKGNQLRAILQKHAADTSLVHQVAACLHPGNLFQVIEKINYLSLPEESLQILAESVEISDLTLKFLRLPSLEKEPLLAYLRPAVMFKVDPSTLYDIILLLQNIELSKPPKKSAFYFLTEAAARQRNPLSKLDGFLLGSSPDQLLNESLSYDISETSFRLDFSILQARALFERFYKNTALGISDFIDSKPLLFKLSPEQLQRFPQNIQEYEVNIKHSISIPVPTACQVTEYVRASCVLTGSLPKNENEFWDIHIRNLGTWVYTLPLSALEGYKTTTLSTAVLTALESPAISPIQAYYLTGKGEALDIMTPNSVMDLETFLHALPASQLVNRKLGEISSHVLLHLVSKLPANNLARTLSLVNKISSSIGDTKDDSTGDGSMLEVLLGNRDVNLIMSLISPKDLELSAEAILKFFAKHRITIRQTVEQLPQQILATLLEHARLKNSSHWRWNNLLESSHVSHLLVGGLTCQHIEDMDTGLFIPILSRYNAIRKKSFPKNLQHCCLEKLISFLKLKMTLTQTDPDMGLISLLEPIEIESIGGYVLVNLPLDAMQISPYLGHILSNIGRLSSAELMLSADVSRLKLIAELAVDKEGNVNTFVVRNLVWFLPPSANTPDLKLMLEAQLLNTTICLPADERRHIATRLIGEFGPPEQWTAGVLAALQDLLIVFDEEELSKISQTSWTKAADSFTSYYNDPVDWIEPSTFYKVCASILGKSEEIQYKKAIGRYIHWRLNAAQSLLDTVAPITQPKDNKFYTENTLNQDEKPNMSITVFNPDQEIESTKQEAEDSEYENSEDYEEKSEENIDTKNEIETITADNSMEKTTTEEHTTGTSTTEKTKVEMISSEKSSTTEDRASEKTTEDSEIDRNISEDIETLVNKSQENTTENMFEDISNKISSESLITGRFTTMTETGIITGMLSITTEKPKTVIITTSTVSNHTSQEKHMMTERNKNLDKNIKYNENLNPCTNLVDAEEDCQNNSSLRSNSTEVRQLENSTNTSTESSTNKVDLPTKIATANYNNNNTSSQILKKTPPSASNNIASFQSKNNLAYSSFQNMSTMPSKTSLNQSEEETSVSGFGKFDTLQNKTLISTTTENQYDTNSYISSSSNNTNNKISHADSSNNSSLSSVKNIPLNIQSLMKNHTDSNNFQKNNVSVTTNNPKSQVSDENLENSDEIPLDEYNGTESRFFVDFKERKRRSIFNIKSNDIKLTCNAIKMVGRLAELALTEADLEEMSDTDVADCRVEFGDMELNEALQKKIWKRIKNDLKLDGTHFLGRLLQVASIADLWDIDFRASDPWNLETIHAFIQYNNNTVVKNYLMRNIVKRNAEFSIDLLAVLGPALCSLEVDNLRALSVIGLDLGPSCPSCLPYLAQRATEELGSVSSWTLHFVHSLQAIVAGLDLDSWKELAASYHKPLTALQPSAVKCLNTSHLEVLSPDQIRMIPAVTLLSLSDHQLAAFNSTQLEAIRNITHPTVMDKMTPTKRIYVAGLPGGNSNQMVPTALLIVFLSILHSLNL